MFFDEHKFRPHTFTTEGPEGAMLQAETPNPSMWDVARTAFQEQQTTRNINSEFEALDQAYSKRIKAYESITGQKLVHPYASLGPYRDFENDASSRLIKEFEEQEKELLKRFPEHAERLQAIQQRSIGADRGLIRRRAIEDARQTLEDYRGLPGTGTVAALGGAMAGMLKDPANVLSLLAGPWGAGRGLAGLAVAASKGAAVNAGVEIASAPFVAEAYRDAGIPYSYTREGLMDVGTAALFGFAAEGGARGLVRGVQTARGKVATVDSKNYIVGWRDKGEAPPEPIVVPRETVRDFQAGDLEATKKVTKALGIDDDPEVRGLINKQEINEAAIKAAREELKIDLETPINVEKYMQALRSMVDESEPPPVAPAVRSDDPGEAKGWSLEANPPEVSDGYLRRIFDDEGNARGGISYRLRPLEDGTHALDVKNIFVRGGRNTVGAKGIRQIKEKLQELHSDVNISRITGDRNSGARAKAGRTGPVDMAFGGLSRLSDEASEMVESGAASAQLGEIVGDHVADPGRHQEILGRLVDDMPQNSAEARRMVGEALLEDADAQARAQTAILGGQPSRNVDLEKQLIDGMDLEIDDPQLRAGAIAAMMRDGTAANDWMRTAALAIDQGVNPKLAGEGFSNRIRKALDEDGLAGLERPEIRPRDSEDTSGAIEEARGYFTRKVDPDQILFSMGHPDAVHPVNVHNMPAIKAEISKIVRRLPKRYRIELQERITFRDDGGRTFDVDGLIDPEERLIKVALATNDPVRQARHEEIHAYRQLGLFTDDEWDTLTRYATENNLRKEYDIDKRYKDLYGKRAEGDELEQMLLEETIADMFANRVGGKSLTGPVNHIIDRIHRFIRRVAEMLGARGIMKVEDVYRRIESGDVGGRGASLDMSQAARMQRAEAQGFDTDTVLYHGTKSVFDEFQNTRATFFTDDPGVASQYATGVHSRAAGESPSVIPVYTKGKTLEISGEGDVIQTLSDAVGAGPVRPGDEFMDDLFEAVQDAGYGRVKLTDIDDVGGKQNQFIVFDQSNIRSVNAAFDADEVGSSRLLASMPDGRAEMNNVDRMVEVNEIMGLCRP